MSVKLGKIRTATRQALDSLDTVAAVTRLLGPGRRSRSYVLWRCPLGTHEDRNPSFGVRIGGRGWKCFACGERGDPVDLARRLKPGTFRDALDALGVEVGGQMKPPTIIRLPTPKPAPTITTPPPARPGPPSEWSKQAAERVTQAAARIWTPEGREAAAYLRGRGLRNQTILEARLGWTPEGITIPWFRPAGVVRLVNVRRHRGRPKYQAWKGSERGGLYPRPDLVRAGRPVVVVEGELDALLLGQELQGLAAVVTLGSASSQPDTPALIPLSLAWPWYVATDRDEAGERQAQALAALSPPRYNRIHPPEGKDWTDSHLAGVDLRGWWMERLGLTRPRYTFQELASWRWGPALPTGPEADPMAEENPSPDPTEPN